MTNKAREIIAHIEASATGEIKFLLSFLKNAADNTLEKGTRNENADLAAYCAALLLLRHRA